MRRSFPKRLPSPRLAWITAAAFLAGLFTRADISSAATTTCTVVGCCTAICPDSTIPECHKGDRAGCTCVCSPRPSRAGLSIEGVVQLEGEITVTALDVASSSDSLVPPRILLQATMFVTPGQSPRVLAQILAARWRSQIRVKDSLTVAASGSVVTVESPRTSAKYLACSGGGPCVFGDANDPDLGARLNGLTFRRVGQEELEEVTSTTDRRPVIRPNPSRTPEVRFFLPRGADVDVSIFDLFGRRITTLVRARLERGSYSRRWNGDDVTGRRVRDGLYFCRVVAGDSTWIERVQLLR